MDVRANERVVWMNGDFIPEREALVPYRERSFIYGDGVFDMTRTFGHRIFRLEEHVQRLYRSLKALRMDATMPPERMIEISREVTARNLHLLDERDDYWVGQRVTRGVQKAAGDNWDHYGPTVIVECTPLPLADRAHLYRDGIRVVTPSVRRTPPDSLTPRAKTHNYLNLIAGELEAKAQDPDGWPILLDVHGNLCEGLGSNIFLVRDGELLTPREKFVLPGVSRATVIELASKLGVPFREADLDLYDAYTADEAFITSTSLCICPVRSVNGTETGAGAYGPVTKRLIDAYVDLVDCDFVQQYLDRLT
ncbi:MAG TPA: aminotransferase class IV [Paracoccaceae bacterium]|nr:aminotransferase class IV [Paracoccaceae bacterium]